MFMMNQVGAQAINGDDDKADKGEEKRNPRA